MQGRAVTLQCGVFAEAANLHMSGEAEWKCAWILCFCSALKELAQQTTASAWCLCSNLHMSQVHRHCHVLGTKVLQQACSCSMLVGRRF